MSTEIETATGFYVYAFLRACDQQAVAAAKLHGIEDAEVTVIARGDLAIAISPIVARKIRPQRKFLAAHQEVVTFISKRWSMLPVSFGLIADNTEQVDHILDSNKIILNEQIDRVDSHVEMTLSLKWTAENIPQYFVDRYSELAEARAIIVAGSATRDDQIEMGRMFEKLLNQERAIHTDKFLQVLRPLTKEIDEQPIRQESDVMRLACLIHRDSEEVFSQAVYAAAELFSDEFAISFNGPWPPYSFVKLALSME